MKIAVNTRFLIKDKLEGIGWFTYEVVRRLVSQHPEHEFIFFFDRPYDNQFIFGPNVQAEVLFPPARHASLWYWWFEWSLPRALKKHQADVFLSTDGFLSLRTKVKTLMVTHDIAHVHYPEQIPFHGRVYYKYFVPKYLERSDRVVTVSQFTKEDILRHYKVPDSKIAVACNGCREEFIPLGQVDKVKVKQQFSDGEDYFFYLGAVHPRKNINRLISAFDQFKSKSGATIKLLIAGRFAWQTGAVKEAFDNAKHKKDIVFLGYVADEMLPKLMGAALALTYLSVFEGFGIPLLEAMQCQVPIIGSKAASIPEVIGVAGLLVNPYDLEEVSEAMEKLYFDKSLCEKLTQRGLQQVKQFTWDKAAKIVYDNLMSL